MDVYSQVKACIECQKFVGKHKLQSLALKPIAIDDPFQQWGLNFIGDIHPPSSSQHRCILIAANFYPKENGFADSTNKIIVNNIKRCYFKIKGLGIVC